MPLPKTKKGHESSDSDSSYSESSDFESSQSSESLRLPRPKTRARPSKYSETTSRSQEPHRTWSLPARLKSESKQRSEGREKKRDGARRAPHASAPRNSQRSHAARIHHGVHEEHHDYHYRRHEHHHSRKKEHQASRDTYHFRRMETTVTTETNEKRVRFRQRDVNYVAGRDNTVWRTRILYRMYKKQKAAHEEYERTLWEHSRSAHGHRRRRRSLSST